VEVCEAHEEHAVGLGREGGRGGRGGRRRSLWMGGNEEARERDMRKGRREGGGEGGRATHLLLEEGQVLVLLRGEPRAENLKGTHVLQGVLSGGREEGREGGREGRKKRRRTYLASGKGKPMFHTRKTSSRTSPPTRTREFSVKRPLRREASCVWEVRRSEKSNGMWPEGGREKGRGNMRERGRLSLLIRSVPV